MAYPGTAPYDALLCSGPQYHARVVELLDLAIAGEGDDRRQREAVRQACMWMGKIYADTPETDVEAHTRYNRWEKAMRTFSSELRL